MKINPDMSAFAVPASGGSAHQKGLTKREFMIAMALSGHMANSIAGSHHGFKFAAAEVIQQVDELIKQMNEQASAAVSEKEK